MKIALHLVAACQVVIYDCLVVGIELRWLRVRYYLKCLFQTTLADLKLVGIVSLRDLFDCLFIETSQQGKELMVDHLTLW